MEERKNLKQDAAPAPTETLDLQAPIEVHLHKLKAEDYREQFIEDHFYCCICGTELELTHVTQFVGNQVKEEAFCSCCRIRTRSSTHSLQ